MGNFSHLLDWLWFQLKIAQKGDFWVDEVESLELNLGSFQYVEWDVISGQAEIW